VALPFILVKTITCDSDRLQLLSVCPSSRTQTEGFDTQPTLAVTLQASYALLSLHDFASDTLGSQGAPLFFSILLSVKSS